MDTHALSVILLFKETGAKTCTYHYESLISGRDAANSISSWLSGAETIMSESIQVSFLNQCLIRSYSSSLNSTRQTLK